MTQQFAHRLMFVILLICQSSICLATETPDPNSSTKYLDAVREFADNVLKYGRDTYGPKHTPLFVDGLNTHTHEPVKWISPEDERWILSNLASQQNLFRTLDGLTRITGDPKYKQAAMDAIKYAFDNLQLSNGLLFWGVGAAYDAQTDRKVGPTTSGPTHCLNCIYPYYELMWEVNSIATKQFIEAFWSAHILDWSNLDMNRYDVVSERFENPWQHEYKGGPVFFRSKLTNGVAFMSAGSDLYYAAALLSKLSGEKEPLVWGKRLAHRYVETRNAKTGISGRVYNLKEDDGAQAQFGNDFRGHVVNLGTLFPHRPQCDDYVHPPQGLTVPQTTRIFVKGFGMQGGAYHGLRPWICQFLLGEILGDDGKEFTRWALEELTAIGRVTYRKKDNSFIPMLTDATSLEGYVYTKDGVYGPKGTTLKAHRATSIPFWAYATGYRLTADEFMWEMVRNIAEGNGFGDIGTLDGGEPKLEMETDCSEPYALLGFLELYSKTQNDTFLSMASRIGDNILAERFHKGFFVPTKKHLYTRFDYLEPLVLLRLEAAVRTTPTLTPQIWPSTSYFLCDYRGIKKAVDVDLIYTLTESAEVPISLTEAAAGGDIDEVKSLIAKGADVNAWGYGPSVPLHSAVINGHKQVVELLIAKGADVDAKDKRGRTPIDLAINQGRKEIAELLIANGADINAKNNAGQTPLDIALSLNRKDIVKLLVEKGADISLHQAASIGDLAIVQRLIENGVDVNAKDASGETPLHSATRRGNKDIVELLIAKSADVNAKNDEGQTPVDIALSRNRSEVVKLLIEKGADVSSIHLAAHLGDAAKVMNFIEQGSDVNTKDQRGLTPLHYAARQGHKEIVEVLLAHGADVNSEGRGNRTAAEFAMQGNHNEVVELLVSKGADISPLHMALYMKDEAKARSLIEGGADVNRRTPYGTTPLYRAVDAGFKDIVELLIAKGANVNAKDNWDWTPLHSAVYSNKDMVEMLIVKGADINARDGAGLTPLWYAEKEGYTEIVELLREHGEDRGSNNVKPVHDVAITGVSALSRGPQDYTVPVVVNIENQGNCDEFFDAKLIDVTDGREIGRKSAALPAPRGGGIDGVCDLILTGESGGKQCFGGWLWCGGDVNADGYDDLLVCASWWNDRTGRVYLFYGGADMDNDADKIFTGEAVGDLFGCWGGGYLADMNKDGFDDVLIGARDHNNRGRVYIFHGGPDMDENPDIVIDPPADATGSYYGRGLCAGDLNGDRNMDLIVNAPNHGQNQGRVYLYFGPLASDVAVDKIFAPETEPNAIFGAYTIARGDVDNDGCDDLLVGSRYYPGGPRFGNGRAWFFYGGPGTTMDETCDLTFDAENPRDQFGCSIDLFDVDNDGYAEVLIGARRWNRARGRVYLYWGSKRATMDNIADIHFDGEVDAKANFGSGCVMGSYVNKDDFGDIVIPAYSYYQGSQQGRAYLYFGNNKASMDTKCDRTLTPDGTENQPHRARIGDFNGDGYGDVVMGGWKYNNEQGRCYLWYGGPGSSTDVTFYWDTTRADRGEHTLKAIASPIKGEKDIADNTVTVTVEVKEPSK